MVRPATLTMAAIEAAIEADQGVAYRAHLKAILPHIEDAYRGADDAFRGHMGASMLGDACARSMWYSFRWYTKPKFSGRILRLFNRGHLEEGRFIAALLTIGVTVVQQDEKGRQYKISYADGHAGGSGDGFACNIPDLPADMWALLEFKTHNDASFKLLKRDGVKIAKPEHFVQMNTYMRKFGLPVALYGAVNKNNDEIWLELVELDPTLADQYMDRGQQVIWMQTAPKRISNSPGWYECKFCDHKPVCHTGAEPDRNCRTCTYSEPRTGGDALWYCTHPTHPGALDKTLQLAGCQDYSKR